MTLTIAQKKAIGLYVVGVLFIAGSITFIGYKTISGKTYKVFRESPIEFGIENSTIECSHCERLFYIKLSTQIKVPEEYKLKYGITENYTTNIIIPNSVFRDMIKIELYDGLNNEKLDIPFKIQYKSGYRWYNYPPKTADLTLSTSYKYFKIVADVPESMAISGLIGVRFKLFDKEIDFIEDPIWWINGVPVNVTFLKNCLTTIITTEKTNYVKETVYLNQTYCTDYPINLTCKKIPAYNYTREIVGNKYIDYQNITNCESYGVKINDKSILWEKYGYKTCSRSESIICCEAEHQSDGNGVCESGEGYVQFDLKTLAWGKNTISKTKQIKELKIE